ncbi:hypothetical protein VCHC42A1_2515, partial [Vibrio cholerae HC-42A1]
MIATSCGG